MNESEYAEWMALHISATGADPPRLSEILAANRAIVCVSWNASYAEMCECSDRLVEFGRVPQWPDKHTNALRLELDAIRAEPKRVEAIRTVREMYGGHVAGCDCPYCNGGEILPAYAAARERLHAAVKGEKPKKTRKRKS